ALACGSSRGDDSSGGGDNNAASTTSSTAKEGDKFGDLATPCGPGDAKGATAQGVTDKTIVIGYGDDKGFPISPGLSHETSDAMRAMMKWCNGQGGINGRTIVGKYYDAKITEVVNATTQACQQTF